MPAIKLPPKTWYFIFDALFAILWGAAIGGVCLWSGVGQFVSGIITGGAAMQTFYYMQRNA
jgi:hypothetical protein